MPKKLLCKKVWKHAVGASLKAKRLHLVRDADGNYNCPIGYCDSDSFTTIRGCRKHVYFRHGWYYFFDKKPNVEEVLPAKALALKKLKKTKRSKTFEMPSFLKNCTFDKEFKNWLHSPVGGMKSWTQSSQISTRVLKYLKFCCQDCCPTWDVPFKIVDYCIGSISSISDFLDYLKEKWDVGFAGMIGYMNALSHVLDFRRVQEESKQRQTFLASEIYIDRVKKSLSKKMRCEWNVLLSVKYLSKIDCWASLEDMQKVVPYHADRFSQILINSGSPNCTVTPHDLSFSTSFMTAVFFLLVKATRPMTFQYLTVEMVENIGDNGLIDQTIFKTKERYGFDTLIFSEQVKHILKGYINCIRPRLKPICDYVLVTRNGTQLSRLSDVFGRLVFQAIGKYINPTRYRQIIETESAEKLSLEEQRTLSLDQKHTSLVARVHYQKLKSHDVAKKGKELMSKLLNDDGTGNSTLEKITSPDYDFFHKKQTDFAIASSSSNNDINLLERQTDTTQAEFANKTVAVTISDIKKKPKEVSCTRQKKVAFSSLEDKFLKLGIEKYGCSWSKILADPEFKFHSSRKTATLCRRAQVLRHIKS